MRLIDRITIHCSATRVTQDFTEEQIKQSHLARGFRTWGYHFYIRKNGELKIMRPINEMGAHAIGYNASSIGICYEGGLDHAGKATDTRTMEQKATILILLKVLTSIFSIKYLTGHRDLSPDLNNNGIIEPNEWLKECPCFDVRTEYFAEFPNLQFTK